MSESVSDGSPVHVESESHLKQLVSEHGVVLLDFHADWCGPCKMLEPTVESIAAETDAVVAKVDIDELREVAQEAGVRSVPTIQFYAGGEPAERFIGVQSEETLRQTVDELSA